MTKRIFKGMERDENFRQNEKTERKRLRIIKGPGVGLERVNSDYNSERRSVDSKVVLRILNFPKSKTRKFS